MAQTTDSQLQAAATATYMGYVVTGNTALDRVTEAGLRGLGRYLYAKTGVINTPLAEGGTKSQPSTPIQPKALDIERDELSIYPVIYWAVEPGQSLSAQAIEKLNQYMRSGGMLFIDTRDTATSERGKAALRRLVEAGLSIPRLIKAQPCNNVEPGGEPDMTKLREQCHVLARSFYILRDFDGRYENAQVWVENAAEFRHDGVATVIVGGSDWASAWAVDDEGRYMLPVFGNDPEQRDFAFRFGVNLVMYALTGNYKNDQVHAAEIIKRMNAQP